MNKVIFSDTQNNELRLSNLKKWEGNIGFNGFAAKFVLSGNETYHIGNNKFRLANNQYIIGNNSTQSVVEINSEQHVWGLCIDISEAILDEVIKFHFEHNHRFLEFLTTDKLLVNKYSVENSLLGKSLNEIGKQLIINPDATDFTSAELFYSLAEHIIFDQKQIFESYDKLNFKKQETNQELFKKLLDSKDWISKNLAEDLDVAKLSSEFGISMYHFIRLFKSTFNLSPYQFILQQRLQSSKIYIEKGASVTDVALDLGFADVQSFSKAFKKQFGIAPSKLPKK